MFPFESLKTLRTPETSRTPGTARTQGTARTPGQDQQEHKRFLNVNFSDAYDRLILEAILV